MKTRLGCLSNKSDSYSDFSEFLPPAHETTARCLNLAVKSANANVCPLRLIQRHNRPNSERSASDDQSNATQSTKLKDRLSTDEVVRWSESFDHLLSHKYGLTAFRTFLKSEFSDENIEFWMACEEYKKIKSSAKLVSKANKIFKEFIDIQAPREVNIDYPTREKTKQSLEDPCPTSLNEVQAKVYSLMERDSYPRFLRSKMYQDMVNRAQAQGQRRSV